MSVFNGKSLSNHQVKIIHHKSKLRASVVGITKANGEPVFTTFPRDKRQFEGQTFVVESLTPGRGESYRQSGRIKEGDPIEARRSINKENFLNALLEDEEATNEASKIKKRGRPRKKAA